jgi:amino acid permease
MEKKIMDSNLEQQFIPLVNKISFFTGILGIAICVFCIAYGIYMFCKKDKQRAIEYTKSGVIVGAVTCIMSILMKVLIASAFSHNDVSGTGTNPVGILIPIVIGFMIGYSLSYLSKSNEDK